MKDSPVKAYKSKEKSLSLFDHQDDNDWIFNNALSLNAIANFEGYLVKVNQAWTKFLGFDLEELTGCPNYGLIPDPLTFRVLPWAPQTGWILSDAYLKTGEPLPFDSRQIARKAFRDLNALGYDLYAGLEVEFSLTKIVNDEINPALLGAPGDPGEPPDSAFSSSSWG